MRAGVQSCMSVVVKREKGSGPKKRVMDDVYSAVFTQRHFALQNDPPDDFRFSSCSRSLSLFSLLGSEKGKHSWTCSPALPSKGKKRPINFQ